MTPQSDKPSSPHDHILSLMEKREKRLIFSQQQRKMEEEGLMPRSPRLLLRNLQRHLEYTGGILLGFLLGMFTLLVNFLVFVRLLHITF